MGSMVLHILYMDYSVSLSLFSSNELYFLCFLMSLTFFLIFLSLSFCQHSSVWYSKRCYSYECVSVFIVLCWFIKFHYWFYVHCHFSSPKICTSRDSNPKSLPCKGSVLTRFYYKPMKASTRTRTGNLLITSQLH